ncbi:hypothetical protein J7E97_08170 [Streptomyces sp. ISL-66]|uniref:hypothetical protein n=1 Tax=Streptomyces sp. ISL-66 TaxID=2819186 RepID=UPI001BEB40F1|nr:hypothetical protein [Streptomyces sp. ISL-66]MBT2467849.1 hypothetical protein [Streptomyces sp. ISL-66]
MPTRTLARPQHASSSTWAHPYPAGAFSPYLYADGGEDPKPGPDGGESDTDDPGPEPVKAEAEPDHKAEAEKYKALMRKHEARAKENATAAKELAELRKQSMSDQERAVDEASAKARTEERVRLAGKLARQGFLAAAAGRIPNATDVADDLNLGKYVGEDGEIDESGLASLVERLAPPKPEKKPDPEPEKQKGRGFDQGPRGTGASGKGSSVATGRDMWAQRKQTSTI